jgi:hypothetical protein
MEIRVGVSAAPQIPAFIRVVWGLRVAPTLWRMEFTLSALAGERTPLTRPGETRSAGTRASLRRPMWRWKSKESISESWGSGQEFHNSSVIFRHAADQALCAQYGLRRGEGVVKPPRDPSCCMCESRCLVICTCERLRIDLWTMSVLLLQGEDL